MLNILKRKKDNMAKTEKTEEQKALEENFENVHVKTADEVEKDNTGLQHEAREAVKDQANAGTEMADGETRSNNTAEMDEAARKAVEAEDKKQGVERDGATVTLKNPKDVYDDYRITPPDTNAPDAGLTPDGTRIAQ